MTAEFSACGQRDQWQTTLLVAVVRRNKTRGAETISRVIVAGATDTEIRERKGNHVTLPVFRSLDRNSPLLSRIPMRPSQTTRVQSCRQDKACG